MASTGQTSRQAASVQCLQTSDDISQRTPSPSLEVASPSRSTRPPRSAASTSDAPPSASAGTRCSMKATWRQVLAPRSSVLSYDLPVNP